jgi:AGCS family alanine or glycine:cation symporter
MYMITCGLGAKWKFLAGIYCFFGVVASFGVGNATQINAVIRGIHSAVETFGGCVGAGGDWLIGILLAIAIGLVLLGGAQRIGRAAERLIPFAAGGYVLLCVAALMVRWGHIPSALLSIFQGAFSPGAVTGGMVGSFFSALQVGVSRGVFTNEAGMGTASIAHASADVRHPAEQGKMGIIEVFLDTIVICTLTALVLLCSGVEIPYGRDSGAELTGKAFTMVLGDWAGVVIALMLCLFALATVLGWGLYGARCAQFLFGEDVWRRFVWLHMGAVVLGAVMQTGTLWRLAEICNGLMALPNLIALLALSHVLAKILKEYNPGGISAPGGTYENFY